MLDALIHTEMMACGIPVDGVSIPDESDKSTWRIYLTNESFRPQADEFIENFDLAAFLLELKKQEAVAAINQRVEAERARYITTLPGKIGEYRQKEAEYERWLASGQPAEPDPALFPIAATESTVYGVVIAEMLQIWGDRAAAWATASAQIAAAERRALLAVAAAQSVADIEAALAGLP